MAPITEMSEGLSLWTVAGLSSVVAAREGQLRTEPEKFVWAKEEVHKSARTVNV